MMESKQSQLSPMFNGISIVFVSITTGTITFMVSQAITHPLLHPCLLSCLLEFLELTKPVLSIHCSLLQYSLPPDICRDHSLTFFRTCTSLPFSESLSLMWLIKILPPNICSFPLINFFLQYSLPSNVCIYMLHASCLLLAAIGR